MKKDGSEKARGPVMSAGPEDDLAQLHYCETLLELGRAAEAAAMLSVLFARDTENFAVCVLFAHALLAVGEPKRAAELAQRAAALVPEHEWPHRLLSRAFLRLGMDNEALREARQAVRLAPHEWRCFLQLAVVAKGRKATLADAQGAAAEALKLAPHEAACHRVAGMVAAALGRRDQARESFENALRLDPQDSATLNELGRLALGGRGPVGGARLADAASGFAQAVRTDPSAMVSRHNLDLVIRSFLAKLTYFVFIDALVVSRGLSHSTGAAARALPVLALAIPAVIAGRFFSKLAPLLRRHVLAECRRRPLRLSVLLGVIGVLALLISGVAPQEGRSVAVGIALTTAAICRVNLAATVRQSAQAAKQGSAPPVWSTGLLWCVAVALLATAAMLVSVAFRAPGVGVRVGFAAAVFAGLASLVFRIIFDRRRNRAS